MSPEFAAKWSNASEMWQTKKQELFHCYVNIVCIFECISHFLGSSGGVYTAKKPLLFLCHSRHYQAKLIEYTNTQRTTTIKGKMQETNWITLSRIQIYVYKHTDKHTHTPRDRNNSHEIGSFIHCTHYARHTVLNEEITLFIFQVCAAIQTGTERATRKLWHWLGNCSSSQPAQSISTLYLCFRLFGVHEQQQKKKQKKVVSIVYCFV